MNLTSKQKVFINNANKTWNFKIGATRSGKTYLDFLYRIPAKTRKLKGSDGLFVIMGVSQSTIERNILEPMRNLYGDKLIGFIQQGKSIVKLFGETYHVVGHEKANAINRIQGASIKYCYIDEIVRMSEPTFEMLKSRLDQDYSCCDATGNPEQPTHFVKKFIDEQIDKGDMYYQHYTIDDNPMLPQSFVDRLKREYAGTVYYLRYILGQWALAEGAIYSMFNNDNIMSVEEWQSKKKNVMYVQIGVDFGGNKSKTAFQATAFMQGLKEIVTFKERRFSQDQDIDYLNKEFEKFIQEINDEGFTIRVVRLDSAEQVIIKSMKTYAIKRAREGSFFINPDVMRNARKNEIVERIRAYQRLMNLNRYKVLETCTITRDAFQNAVWSDKTDKDGKDKRLDDGTINVDTLDAQEYSTEETHEALLKVV